MSSGGNIGQGPSGKSGSAPGFVDLFSSGLLAQNVGLSSQAMHNRYSQLGLGVPGGSAVKAASQGGNLQSTGAGTPEQMDIGSLPSLVGGITGMGDATMGQMQNNSLVNAVGSGASSKGGGLGSALGAGGKLLGGL